MKLAKMKTSDTPPPGGACRESRSPIQKCYSLSGKPRDSFFKKPNMQLPYDSVHYPREMKTHVPTKICIRLYLQ